MRAASSVVARADGRPGVVAAGPHPAWHPGLHLVRGGWSGWPGSRGPQRHRIPAPRPSPSRRSRWSRARAGRRVRGRHRVDAAFRRDPVGRAGGRGRLGGPGGEAGANRSGGFGGTQPPAGVGRSRYAGRHPEHRPDRRRRVRRFGGAAAAARAASSVPAARPRRAHGTPATGRRPVHLGRGHRVGPTRRPATSSPQGNR